MHWAGDRGRPLRLIPGDGCVSILFCWIADWYPSVEMLHSICSLAENTHMASDIGNYEQMVLRFLHRCRVNALFHFPRRALGALLAPAKPSGGMVTVSAGPGSSPLQPGPPNSGVRNNLVRKSVLAPPPVALTQASPEMTPVNRADPQITWFFVIILKKIYRKIFDS